MKHTIKCPNCDDCIVLDIIGDEKINISKKCDVETSQIEIEMLLSHKGIELG